MNRILKVSGEQVFEFLNNFSNKRLYEELLNIVQENDKNEIMIAGQSVVSAIIRLLGLDINAPINDIDVFVSSKREDISMSEKQNKMVNETVLFSKILHDIDYGVMSRQSSRYKVLNSHKRGIINVTEYLAESARDNIKDFLQVFDINSTKAGIVIYFKEKRIDTIELIILPEAIRFLKNKELYVSRFYTPVHSLIRAYKKDNEFYMLKDKEREIILPNVLAIENLLSEISYSEKFIRNIPDDVYPNYSSTTLKDHIKIEMSFSRKPMFFGSKTLEKMKQNEKDILKNAVLLKRNYKESISDIEIDFKNKIMYTLPNVMAKQTELEKTELWTLVHKNYKNVGFEEIKTTVESLKKYNLGFILNQVIDFMELYLNGNDLFSITKYLSLNSVDLRGFIKNMMFVFERFSAIYAEYKRFQLSQQDKKFFNLETRNVSYLDKKKNILKNFNQVVFDPDKPMILKDLDPTYFYSVENLETLSLVDKEKDKEILIESFYKDAYIGRLTYLEYEKSKRFAKLLLPLVDVNKQEFLERSLIKNSNDILYSVSNMNLFIEKLNKAEIIDKQISNNVRRMNALSPRFYKNKKLLSFMADMAKAFMQLNEKANFEEREWVNFIPLKAYKTELTFDSSYELPFSPIDFLERLSLPLYYFYDNENNIIGVGLDENSLLPNAKTNFPKIAIIFNPDYSIYIPEEFKCYYFQPNFIINWLDDSGSMKIQWWWENLNQKTQIKENNKKRDIIFVSYMSEDAIVPF